MQIGIDLGGSHIGIGIINEKGKIVSKKEQDLIINNMNESEVKQYIRDIIITNISEVLRMVGSPMCLINKIGIATPGKVENGIIKEIHNLGIKEFNLAKDLEEYYEVPVILRNDAKCAGIAEKKFGALMYYSDAVFLCIGTGIGGATFYNGNLIEPKSGAGSEYGHMIIKKDGKLCKCGNRGCWETYCSMKNFKNMIIERFNLDKNTNSKDILKFVQDRLSDLEINNIIDEYIDDFILGIWNINNIVQPEVICFGGGFVHFRNILFNRILEKIQNSKYKFSMPKLILGTLENDAGMIGAVNISIDKNQFM